MSRQVTVYHLASEEEQTFLRDQKEEIITPESCVIFCYAQEHGRLMEYYTVMHESRDGIVDRLNERFPLVYGSQSVGCGDWASLLKKAA